MDNDIRYCKIAAGVASPFMALRYTAGKLLNLNRNYYLANHTYELCRNVGILQPMRYIHCASRREFIQDISDSISVPVFQRKTDYCAMVWILTTCQCSNTRGSLHYSQCLRVWWNHLFLMLALWTIRQWFYRILSSKKKKKNWHKQGDGLLFNELPLATDCLMPRDPPAGVGASLCCIIKNSQ